MNRLARLKREYQPALVTPKTEEEMKWFRESKFGMFIHWGLYALLEKGEWVMYNERMSTSEYAELTKRFDTKEYDPKKWAKTAKAAGMKYMVLTTRHHDGFCLFDSKVSSFNSMNCAAKRDFVKEYVEACRAEGLKVGFYYSPMDWRFPGYFMPEMYYDNALEMKKQCWAQLEELMTNYGKIDLLWFDGEWLAHGGEMEMPHHEKWYEKTEFSNTDLYFNTGYFWESDKLIKRIRELQPEIVINNRGGWVGDFEVRERIIGEMRTDKPWDTNDCLARSWGWIPGTSMRSLRDCVKLLTDVVCRDGNLLLNVGPKPEGVIEDRQVRRLEQVGTWLGEFGETIYNTRGGPFLPGEWGGSTYRDKTVFIHVTEWKDDILVLPNLKNNLIAYSSLTSDRVHVEQTDHEIRITVPLEYRHPYDTIIVLNFDSNIVFGGVKGKKESNQGLGDGLTVY